MREILRRTKSREKVNYSKVVIVFTKGTLSREPSMDMVENMMKEKFTKVIRALI
jgi:Cft2 family RNA processing exonuclease